VHVQPRGLVTGTYFGECKMELDREYNMLQKLSKKMLAKLGRRRQDNLKVFLRIQEMASVGVLQELSTRGLDVTNRNEDNRTYT
jgi:hypothetical protein